MRNLILLSLVVVFCLSCSLKNDWPDLSKKEDLKDLGVGRIIESDNSIITKITLFEVKEYWVVYLKDESMHDMEMEKINRIEFKNSRWGALKITFPNNKPQINRLSEY